MGRFLLAVSILLAAACSAHSPFIATPTTDVRTVSVPYPAHSNRVLVTEKSLPADQYELIEIVDVGKVFYGSSSGVKGSLADEARGVGADAVIEVQTWTQPSGWAWAAPHGRGKAVKLKGVSREELQAIGGEWY